MTGAIREILQGALHVWRVDGAVTVAAGVCTVRSGNRVVTVARVIEDGAPPYWDVAEERQDGLPPQPCAGIQGMLRAVRDRVDPLGAAGRLIVGPSS